MKSIVLSLAVVSALSAGVYDYGYNGVAEVASSEKNNPLFYGDFERIIRYDAIPYTPGNPVKLNIPAAEMDKMYQSIDGYTNAKVPYKVSVIGHTRKNKDIENEVTQESTYFGSLQNRWMESISDAKTNREECERAVGAIKNALIERHVKEGDILAECRDGADPLYLENDKDAREKNYRVAVTLYASKVENKVQYVAPKPKPAPVVAKPVVVAPPPPPAPAPVVAVKPVELDSDGDGVLDNSDACPKTPKGYKVDEKGCPREVTLHINFATASAKIPASASKDITDLLGFMKEYTAYSIEIVGHTDSIGESTPNQVLSVKRAKSLEKALVEGGISADRITATGMGESQPVASNMEAQGRAKNRRVEVKMYVNQEK